MQLRVIPCFCMAAFAVGCASEQSAQPTAMVATAEPRPHVVAEPQPQAVAEPQPPPYVAQVNTFSSAQPVAQVNRVAFKQVLLDGEMAQWVVVEDVRRSKTNDGYERIQVLVKNLTTAPIRTRYRFDWQDANGVVVMDPDHSGWEKMTLIPGDNGTFTSIAPRKDCADFRLRMAKVQE